MNRNIKFRISANSDDLKKALRDVVSSSVSAGKASGAGFRSNFGNPFKNNPVQVIVNTNPAQRAIKSLVDSSRGMFSGMGEILKGVFQGIGQSIYNSVIGVLQSAIGLAKDLMGQVMQAGARAESTRLKLSTMLGEQKGKAAYSAMNEYAATTPFEDAEVAESGTMLLNALPKAKEDAAELTRVLKMVGEVAAGSGNNIKDIATIMMQVNSVGKTTNGDMLQLAQRGVPIYQELSKVLGKSVAEVQDMISKSQVGADVFMQAIENMTTGTGVYAGMVDKLATTFEGRMSNIQGTIQKGMVAVFDTLKPAIDTVLEQLLEGMDVGEQFSYVMTELADIANEFATYLRENPEIIQSMITAGATFASDVLIGLVNLAKNLFEWFSQNPHIFETLNTLGAALGVIVDQIGVGYKIWGETLSSTSSIINGIVNLVKNLWTSSAGVRQEFSNLLTGTLTGIRDAIQNIWDKTVGWLQSLRDSIPFLTQLQGAFSGIASSIQSAAQSAAESVGELFSSGQNAGISTKGVKAYAPTGKAIGNSVNDFTDMRGNVSHHRGEKYARDFQLRTPDGNSKGVPVTLQEDIKIISKGFQAAGRSAGAGHFVNFEDSRGVKLTMMHLEKAVEHAAGSIVKAGNIVGYQGRSGLPSSNQYYHLDVRTMDKTERGLNEFLLNNFSASAMAGKAKSASTQTSSRPSTQTSSTPRAASTQTSSTPRAASTQTSTAATRDAEKRQRELEREAEKRQRESQREAEKTQRELEKQADELAKQQLAQAENRTQISQQQSLEKARVVLEGASETTKLQAQRDYDIIKEQTDLANTLADLKKKFDNKELTQADYKKFSDEAKNLSSGRLKNINNEYLKASQEKAQENLKKYQEEQEAINSKRVALAEKLLDYDIEEFEIKSKLLAGTKEGLQAQGNANRLRATQGYNSELNRISQDQLAGNISAEEANKFRVRAEGILRQNLSIIEMETQKAISEMQAEKQRVLNEMLTERLRRDNEYRQQIRERTYNASMAMAENSLSLSTARASTLRGDSQVYAQRENAKTQIGIDLTSQIYQLEEMHRAGTLTASQLALAKNNLIEISEIQLGQVNDQFLTLEQTIMQGFVSSLSSALEGLITGTQSLGEALSNVLGSMAQMLAQLAVRQLMGSIFPGIPGMASGGLVDAAAKERGLSGSQPVLAVLNRDEIVLNKKQAKALQRNIPSFSTGTAPNLSLGGSNYSSGGIVVNIPITMNDSPGGVSVDALRNDLENVVTGVILKHKRNGGLLK